MWSATKQWLSQFYLLVWKNLKLRLRYKKTLVAELLAPILFILLWVAFMGIMLDSNGQLANTYIPPVNEYIKADKILYAPNTSEVEEVISHITAANSLSSSSFLGFSDYSLLREYYLANSDDIYAGLWFGYVNGTNITGNANITSYAISMDNSGLPSTTKQASNSGRTATQTYINKGFASLQQSVDMAIIKILSGTNITSANVSTIQMPTSVPPIQQRWQRSGGFGQVGSIFFLIGLFVSCFRMMTNRVTEKESKIRELLYMGGIRGGVESASWWFTVLLIATGPVIISVYILMGIKIYYYSTISYVLLLFVATLFSLIALAQLVSVFTNKAKFAGMLGLSVVLVFGAVGIVVTVIDDVSPHLQLFLCIFAPTGFAVGNGAIFKLEDDFVGLHSDQYKNGEPAVRSVILLLCFDTFLYTVLAWYLDAVLPGEFGVTRSPFFIFERSFWCSFIFARKPHESESRLLDNFDNISNNIDIERVATTMKGREQVVLQDVRKEFVSNNQTKVAVDGLSFTLYTDQITALLGHNGAGKTTTISMLTGLIPPTSGHAYIGGWSIAHEMNDIRSSLLLGVCPQSNVLWDDFTVEEHLYIHGGLKGVELSALRRTMESMITDLGLEEKRHTLSSALSGGQKRKLQLAIAFLGYSKVIFLDEPTSGMDPVTRRIVWDFLNKYKAGKAIVLTTHFMDEADILADRIIVISKGKVRCAGTPLFLKSRFGVGYLLTMVRSPTCNPANIDSLIKSYIPDATRLSEFGAELSYRLPGNDLNKFVQLFAQLDSVQKRIGIDSYGISLTTLEEVFLRIGLEEFHAVEGASAVDVGHDTSLSQKKSTRNAINNKSKKGHSFFQQVAALFMKRLQTSPRDMRTLIFAILLPLIIVAGAIALGKTSQSNTPRDFFNENLTPLNFRGFYFTEDKVGVQGGAEVGSELLLENEQYVDVPANASMKPYLKQGGFYASAISYFANNNTFANESITLDYQVWFNKTYDHSLPITMNVVHTALLKYLTNDTFEISTSVVPFLHVLSEGEKSLISANMGSVIFFTVLMMAAFALILGGIITPLVQERTLNVKRLLLVSGTSKTAYWVSTFLWDFVLLMLVALLTLILFASVGMTGFEREGWGAAFVVFAFYAMAGLPFAYVFSLRVKSASTAMVQLFALIFIISFVMFIGYLPMVMNYVFNTEDGTRKIAQMIGRVFCAVWPNFALGFSLATINGFVSPVPRLHRSWFDIESLGFPILFLAIHSALWWMVLAFKERNSSGSSRSKVYTEEIQVGEDTDVVNERNRVAGDTGDVIVVRGMRKVYKAKKNTKVAVANFSLGIPSGQCFGLLGMNGAGKSTTLAALSGDITPTAGNIFLNGHNLLSNPRDALRFFGWCPQFDALVDNLTGRQQLTLYARIKGLDESIIPETVSAFLEMLDMEHLADRLAGGYSGGNKRKLSLAIAMIGNPPIVFLDEPSTGMDPLSKRLMWNVITELGHNKAIIVTTHYMEECEALCSRIGIMSQGRLVGLGSSQHLKSRFATGYTVQMKAKPGQIDFVRAQVSHIFPNAHLTDQHDDMLQYQLPMDNSAQLAPVFGALVDLSDVVDDFAVSQTTLEQVFLKLAQEKDQPLD